MIGRLTATGTNEMTTGIQCGRLGNDLHCAAYRGHAEVVKLLLHHVVDNKIGGKFESAFHAACRGNARSTIV